MATNIQSLDQEDTLSQALSWETCSQYSWSIVCESHQGSSARPESNLRTSNISRVPRDHPPALKNNIPHRNSEPEPEGTEFFPSSRYLQGRPPLREDGNPKGKHPRKPLPSWHLKKLKMISTRGGVAEDYGELIWHEQREAQRQQRKLARGKTPDKQQNRRFSDSGGRLSPAHMKKKKVKMAKRRKNERKRANRTRCEDTSQPKPPKTSRKPPSSMPMNSETQKRKTWMEGYIKPHYFTLFDALAKQQGHAEYAWGCDYCEERLRDFKTSQFKNWRSQALIDGVKDVAEHDHLEEMVRTEIEKYTLEDGESWREEVSMDEIVRWREEPGYSVRCRSGKRKGGKKEKVVTWEEVAVGDILDLPVKGRNETESEDEWEDMEWDKSDGSGSVWVEVWLDDG